MTGPAIDRPIFIVAPHRSGTTLLYDILGRHPELGYLNLANRRFPSWPRFAHALTRLGISDDRPREAQVVWDRFWTTDDDTMMAEHAMARATNWHRRLAATVLRLRRVPRFLAKYPRLSLRMAWIDAMFPGALFLHIMRDWRAVVNSTLGRRTKRERGSGKWYGLRIPGWRQMGQVPWEIVAGRQYRVATRAIEEQRPSYGDRFLEIRYTQLCSEPVETLRKVIERCGLSWTSGFEESIPRDLVSANYKWREKLDQDCVERIRAEDPEFYVQHEEEG